MSGTQSASAPRSWSIAELQSIADVNYGKALSASTRSGRGEIPVIGSSGTVGHHDQALVEGPCVVVGRKGAAGAVHLIDQSSWPIDTAYFIQPPGGVNLRYLYYLLDSQQLGKLDKSTAIPSLSRDDLYKVEVPVAPSAEQLRIVEKLEEILSDLDAGVAELKAAQRKLAQYRQSLLKAAVEGALTADWRAARGEAEETGAELLQRILAERRTRWEQKQLAKFAKQAKTSPKHWIAKYPAPAPATFTVPPPLPEGWTWASLDQLIAESSYGTSMKCAYDGDGYPVLRIPNVGSGRIDLQDIKFATAHLNLEFDDYLTNGDILVIRTNGSISLVGRAAVITASLPQPHYFASYLLRLRCVDTRCTHRWIWAILGSPYGRRWIEARAASSAGQHNISLSTLLTMPIPLPPLAEQDEALTLIQRAMEAVDQQARTIDKSLAQAAAQRKNILKAAFAGQLVPQDPNDEPASELLARIRAQRASNAGGTQRRRRNTA